jgi:hypothetical protein
MDYLIQHFINLKDFYSVAAGNGQAVITYLS